MEKIASVYPITVDRITGRQNVAVGSSRHVEHLKNFGAIIEGEIVFFPTLGVTLLAALEEAQSEQLQLVVKQIIIGDVLRAKPELVIDVEKSGFYEVPDETADGGARVVFVLHYYPKDNPQETTTTFGSTAQDASRYLSSTQSLIE